MLLARKIAQKNVDLDVYRHRSIGIDFARLFRLALRYFCDIGDYERVTGVFGRLWTFWRWASEKQAGRDRIITGRDRIIRG